nr:hypothetical protein [Chloroflexia bacterium]
AMSPATVRRAQIAYRDVVARGWPIGSGCAESAHQHVVQDRLKGRGMRWTRAGAEALLAVRLVDANDQWLTTWDQVGPTQRASRCARITQRRTTRQVRNRPPKLVEVGVPTATHPWRRFRLPGSPRFPSP